MEEMILTIEHHCGHITILTTSSIGLSQFVHTLDSRWEGPYMEVTKLKDM